MGGWQVRTTYSGPLDTPLGEGILACDPEGPLVINISKLYPSTDAQDFHAFGRILSGTVRSGQEVRVLGEGFSPEDEEDMALATVEEVWVHESR
jgi:U5 small nuclear ribonucleoprotein component